MVGNIDYFVVIIDFEVICVCYVRFVYVVCDNGCVIGYVVLVS